MKKREELDRLNNMSEEELREEAQRLKDSLFRINFKLALGEVDAVGQTRRDKKSLARVQTLMRRRKDASPRVLSPRAPSNIGRDRIEAAVDATLSELGEMLH